MNTDATRALVDRIRRCSRPLAPIPTGHPPDTRPLPGIRAVLFDVYGTLLVSGSGDVGTAREAGGGEPLREALEAAGLLHHARPLAPGEGLLERIIRRHHEQARRQGVAYPEVDILAVWSDALAALGLPPASPEALRHLAVAYECLTNPVWPMPEMQGVLEWLAGRGLPLGIVSNAQFYTPLTLEALTGRDLATLGFDPALCAWSWRLGEAKPSPRLFEPVLHRLRQRHGLAPREVLYVGNDLLKDVLPAHGLGLQTVLFAGDRRSLRLREGDPRVTGLVPHRAVTALAQLRQILEP